MKMRSCTTLVLATTVLLVASVHSQVQPPVDEEVLITESPRFDPYKEKMSSEAKEMPAQQEAKEQEQASKTHVEKFDFDPSEGLSFYVGGNSKECFYENVKGLDDELSGAYIVASADSHIDLEIKNSKGETIYRRVGDAEGHYQAQPKETGEHQLCFVNPDADGKLVTHVTNTLQSQHPVQKEYVSVVAKFASHLDIRLGEVESQQRLLQIRTDRHIKVEDSMSKRVSFYGGLECMVYVGICILQVVYIKKMLEKPVQKRTWA